MPHCLFLLSCYPKSGESKSASISGNLALGDSEKGLSISGNADKTIATKSGLKVGKLKNCKNMTMTCFLLVGT